MHTQKLVLEPPFFLQCLIFLVRMLSAHVKESKTVWIRRRGFRITGNTILVSSLSLEVLTTWWPDIFTYLNRRFLYQRETVKLKWSRHNKNLISVTKVTVKLNSCSVASRLCRWQKNRAIVCFTSGFLVWQYRTAMIASHRRFAMWLSNKNGNPESPRFPKRNKTGHLECISQRVTSKKIEIHVVLNGLLYILSDFWIFVKDYAIFLRTQSTLYLFNIGRMQIGRTSRPARV